MNNQPFGRRRTLRTGWRAALVGFASCGFSMVSYGQSATPGAESGAAAGATRDLEEVIVTARRRTENLEKVPVTVSVISADALVERQVETPADLQNEVAGLVMRGETSNNQFNFALRGQSVDAFTNSQPGVLQYFNEYQTTAVSEGGYYDIGSLQVLKGPQGTLFGRNTTGGAVLLTTAQPTNTFGGYATLRLGNYADQQVEAALNVPFTDKLQVRFAGVTHQHDGYVRNLLNGHDLNNEDFQSGRVTVAFRPTDDVVSTTTGQYDRSKNNGPGLILYSLYSCAPGAPPAGVYLSCFWGPAFPGWNAYLAAHPNVPPGGIEQSFAIQQQIGPWKINAEAPTLGDSVSRLVTNTTSVKFGNGPEFKNIVGYSKSYNNDEYDQDGTPITYLASISLKTRLEQYSWEPQLLGTAFGGSFNWITGGYFSWAHEQHTNVFNAFDLRPVANPILINYDYLLKSRTEGGFVQGTYDLSSWTGVKGLTFTAGARYTTEAIEIQEFSNPNTPVGQTVVLGRNDSKPSWQVGFEWQIDPALLTYVTTRGSWRSGGFNGFVPPVKEAAFEPETTRDVELGTKFQGHLGQMPARINAAVYTQKVDNTQRLSFLVINGAQAAFTINAPNGSKTQGAEIEVAIDPVHALQLGLTYAYTDATFGTPSTVGLFGQTVTLGPYGDAPRHTGNVYGRIKLPMPTRLGKLSLRAEASFRSAMYFSNVDGVDPGTRLSPYTLLNGRLEWNQVGSSGLSLAAYVKNAANKEYFTGGLPVGSQSGHNMALVGDPRIYGMEANWRF
jgi:iron complex outermembrane recepter protein